MSHRVLPVNHSAFPGAHVATVWQNTLIFVCAPGDSTEATMTYTRKGCQLNSSCMALNKVENHGAFREDENAYLEEFGFTDALRQAILDREKKFRSRNGDEQFIIIETAW